MRKYLMVAAALMVAVAAHSKIVKADAINNLTISKITAPDEVPQSKNPCIIMRDDTAKSAGWVWLEQLQLDGQRLVVQPVQFEHHWRVRQ